MIIIRHKNTNKEINKNLLIDSTIKHFEIVYKNKNGRFVYSNNKGNLLFIVRQLEKENLEFILYTSANKFLAQEKAMFDVNGIGFIILDNTYSKVQNEELPILVELFEEQYKNDKNITLINSFYKFIASAVSSQFIDNDLNILIFNKNNEIINRNMHRGIYYDAGRIWISDNKKEIVKTSKYDHHIDYSSLAVELLDESYKPITNCQQLQIANKFTSFMRSCHKTMSIKQIISEFKSLYFHDNDIKIDVNFNSDTSCEVIIQNPTANKTNKQKEYTSIKQLIEDYHTSECIIRDDFKNFSQGEIAETMRLYPRLFAEILLEGWSIYDEKNKEKDENLATNQEEEFFNDFDEEYQAFKEEQIFDPGIGRMISIYTCYQCEEEYFEDEVKEFLVKGNLVYLCTNCTNEPKKKKLSNAKSGGF